MIDLAAILGSAAVGAAGFAGYRWASPKLEEGGPPNNPSLVRSSRGEGRQYNVAGGAFCWDRRFEEGPPDIMRDSVGRTARWGTPAAASMAYGLCLTWLAVTTRWLALANRTISAQATERAMRARAAGHAYDLGGCTRSELDLLARMVDAQCKTATALRILGRACEAASLSADRVSGTQQSGVRNLRRIRFVGPWNPMALVSGAQVGTERWAVVNTDPSAWEVIGITWLRALQEAFPQFMQPATDGDRRALDDDLRASLTRYGSEAQQQSTNQMKGPKSTSVDLDPAPPATMGLGVLGLIAVVIVAVIGAVAAVNVLSKAMTHVSTYLGYDSEYHNMLLDQWEQETEACRRGDTSACARAQALDQQIRNMTTPLTLVGRMAGLGIGIAGGVIVFWLIRKGWDKSKGRIGNETQDPQQLQPSPPPGFVMPGTQAMAAPQLPAPVVQPPLQRL